MNADKVVSVSNLDKPFQVGHDGDGNARDGTDDNVTMLVNYTGHMHLIGQLGVFACLIRPHVSREIMIRAGQCSSPVTAVPWNLRMRA
eukprot:365942-Chlamydomonas_euryale.AAC.7